MGLQRQIGRAPGILVATALGTSLLASSGLPVRADDDSTQSQEASRLQQNVLVDVDLNKAKLSDALNLIKRKTGINLVFMNQAHEFGTVTLTLRSRPVGEVLRLMAESAGADIWQKDGIYWVGPKGSAPQPEMPKDLEDNQPPERIYEKIRLKYSDPHAILAQLGASNGQRGDIMELYKVNVMRMLVGAGPIGGFQAPATSVQFAPNTNQPTTVAPSVPTGQNSINNLPPNTDVRNLNATPNGNGSSTDQSAQRGGDPPQEFGRGGQAGFGGGGFGGQGGGGGGFGGQGGGFGGGGGLGGGQGGFGGGGLGGGQGGGFGQAAGLLLPTGIRPQELFALDADNSVIVSSTDPKAIRDLKKIIALLDVKPQQIMIKAEFVTVSQNDVSSFGITWNFQKVNLVAGVNTGYQTSNTAFIQYAAGNVQTQLSFILTTGRGKLVASPIATTLNNLPVTVQFTRVVPVFLSTPVVTQNGTVVLSPTITTVTALTGLVILPRINGDGSISLFGAVQVSDFPDTVTGPNGASAPIQVFQTVPVQRIIRNGDTMVIGGLIRKNDTLSTNKVPLLGDLPLIGNLFRSRNVTVDDSELLVFITPTIIPERPPLTAPSGLGASAPGGALGAGTAGPGTSGGGVAP